MFARKLACCLALSLGLISCGPADDSGSNARAERSGPMQPASLPEQQSPSPANPAPVTPPAAPRAWGDAAQEAAAAEVVRSYYSLIESGRYADAWHLRWNGGGISIADFSASFDRFAEYHATVGTPFKVQGAAGSLYVEVPVQLYGRLKDGKPFGSVGTITLRKSNHAAGAGRGQNAWQIYTG